MELISSAQGSYVFNRRNTEVVLPGVEQVLTIHLSPLRVEFYERNAHDKRRLTSMALFNPFANTLLCLVELAHELDDAKAIETERKALEQEEAFYNTPAT